MKKHLRGMGRVFQRGDVWWIAYSYRGREFRESSQSRSETTARGLLKKRLGEMGRGRLTGPMEEKVTFQDLTRLLICDYQINGRRSLRSAKLSVGHLEAFFGLDRALDIRPDRVGLYIRHRQEQGASNASINRELAALKRMFSLAVKAERLSTKPNIPRLEEHNARQGFIDHASYLALRENLPEYLKDPVTFLYLSGWRVSEMKALEWRDVDLAGRMVRLRPELSKNKSGRLLPVRSELLDVLERAAKRRRLDCVFVFHNEARPIGDFRKSWRKACELTGLTGIIVHDLRRTAVRNMVRAGVSEKVAMELSGHKTRSIFDRYNIVDEADLANAAEKLGGYLEEQVERSTVIAINQGGKGS